MEKILQRVNDIRGFIQRDDKENARIYSVDLAIKLENGTTDNLS